METDKMKDIFDQFTAFIGDIALAAHDEDEEALLETSSNFAAFFATFISRMVTYEKLLEQIAKKSSSQKNKDLIERVLQPDNSDEVDQFMEIINKNKL